MEKEVRSIEKDGLLWGSARLMPVGFGIKKLQITAVIEDAKVIHLPPVSSCKDRFVPLPCNKGCAVRLIRLFARPATLAVCYALRLRALSCLCEHVIIVDCCGAGGVYGLDHRGGTRT